jgi:DNA-binding CsgD family transcriptional regulator
MATAQGKAAARCEALTRLAVEAARLGKASGDEELFAIGEDAATQVEALAASLSGHPQWPMEAKAALATIHLARGDTAVALAEAQSAIEGLVETNHEDRYFDVTLPAGEVLAEAAPPEALAFARSYMQLELSRIVQGTLDDEIRARWLRGPIGSRLVALAGEPIINDAPAPAPGSEMDDADRVLLQALTEGMTNREMAARLDIPESEVAKRLARIIATLGATDRAQATSIAFRGLAPVAA